MKKYLVTVSEDSYRTYHVYANNLDEAEDLVLDGKGKLIDEKTFSFEIESKEIE